MGSLRGLVLADWEALGLAGEPDVGDNGVHASASPFEGLAERLNWVGTQLEEDAFGQQQLEADGTKGSLFDSVEDLDSTECLAKLSELYAFAPAEEAEELDLDAVRAQAREKAAEFAASLTPEEAAAAEAAMADQEEGVRGSSTHVDLNDLKDSGTGELSAEEFAALRAKTKTAAECSKNMTEQQKAEYGCKTGVAASAVREDSDDSDEEGADFQMGAEGQGALLADY